MISDNFGGPVDRPGIRLHRMELYNWGTFDSSDGSVYVAKIEGRTTLLVGRNGAGKSTLVDAILTLLVPNSIRNYNVAAGAKKTERTERTYVQGACDQQLASEESVVRKLYLRNGTQFYSIILAHFYDEAAGSGFTLVQILYPKADGSIEKVFALGEGDKSITNNLQGLSKAEGLIAALKNRGFKATKTFQEYHQWFLKRTRVKPLAMDVFNHTVAVKDIRSLNAFIRDHMLEPSHGKERVQKLIDHFSELRKAHRQLVRIRTQYDLLVPIEKNGLQYRKYQEQLAEAENISQASDAFFTQKTLDLAKPLLEQHRTAVGVKEKQRDELGETLKLAAREARLIENEIDRVGGDRMRQIPQLIELEQTHWKHKEERRIAFSQHASQVRLTQPEHNTLLQLQTSSAFSALKQAFQARSAAIQDQTKQLQADRDLMVTSRASLLQQLAHVQVELEALSRRRNNLPANMARLRAEICANLVIDETDLPFAAELIAVRDEESEWESSIEMVLNSLALSLLVPDHLYHRVSTYIDRHRLVDHGRGQRLNYLHVGIEGDSKPLKDRWHDQALLRKLKFREEHETTAWLVRWIESRFNYRCCESLDDFHQTRSFAITVNRHSKAGLHSHTKDDRDKTNDPSRYVLGWNNQTKKQRLAATANELQTQVEAINKRIATAEDNLRLLASESVAIDRCLSVHSWSDIDSETHRQNVESLQAELKHLQDSNDKVSVLKKQLVEIENNISLLTEKRDSVMTELGDLNRQIMDGERLVSNALAQINQAKSDGLWSRWQAVFDKIDLELHGQELFFENLSKTKNELQAKQAQHIGKLREIIAPFHTEMRKAMLRYLTHFKEDTNDLDAAPESLPSFIAKLEAIRHEDLPRHESRFKERLNDTVSKEVGVFHSELIQEGKNIQGKIDELNVALKELPYNLGTYMRLDMRAVRNAEITEFKNSLRSCLDDTFDNSPDANEARFVRMEEVINRLSTDSSWRERVIDVRRWYDFGACEIDLETGVQRSYYEDSSGQSGGEKAKLAFTILVAAIAYQYDLDLTSHENDGFHFVVVDEMFSKIDDRFAVYALKLFERFGLQLLIVAPLDAKARVTEPFVQHYLQVLRDERSYRSQLVNMTAREYEEVLAMAGHDTQLNVSGPSSGRRKSPK